MNQDQITRIEKIKAVLDAATKEGAVVQFGPIGKEWLTPTKPSWDFAYNHYRVLLPSQPTKQSITAKEMIGSGVMWVSCYEGKAAWAVEFVNFEANTFRVSGESNSRSFEDPGYTSYSFNLRDWHPFTKEVPGEMVVQASTE